MYLKYIESDDIKTIKKLYYNNDNRYVCERTGIDSKTLIDMAWRGNWFKKTTSKNRFGANPDTLEDYKNSYYFKLLTFCQSLPMKQHGNILPYFDKYGVRKLKEMYKLSLIVNKDENKN